MGLLRLLLALCVVAAHSRYTTFEVLDARAAVVLFYTMSGFYMALILNRKYTGPHAVRAFLVSRFLRLWVPYVVVVVVFLLGLAATGMLAERLEPFARAPWPLALAAIASNLLIVGQDLFFLLGFDAAGAHYAPYVVDPLHNGRQLLLIDPMFSVGIEFFLYLLAPLFVRDVRRTFVVLGIGLVWHGAVRALGLADRLDVTYHLAPIGLLYFPLGSLAWWATETWLTGGGRSVGRGAYAGAAVVLAAAAMATPMVDRLSFVATIAAMPLLFRATRSQPLDRFLGELSYPVYLLHMPLLELTQHQGWFVEHWAQGWFLTALSLAAAVVIHLAVDRPLDGVRERIARRLGGLPPEPAGSAGAVAAG